MGNYKQYIVEARNEDGSLNLEGNQPPFLTATEDQLFDYYFQQHPNRGRADWWELRQFFALKGWKIRKKTW